MTVDVTDRDPRNDPHKGDIISKWPTLGPGAQFRVVVVNRDGLNVSCRMTTRRNVVTMPLYRWQNFAWRGEVKKVAGAKKQVKAVEEFSRIPF